jgi:hypothetical protein
MVPAVPQPLEESSRARDDGLVAQRFFGPLGVDAAAGFMRAAREGGLPAEPLVAGAAYGRLVPVAESSLAESPIPV